MKKIYPCCSEMEFKIIHSRKHWKSVTQRKVSKSEKRALSGYTTVKEDRPSLDKEQPGSFQGYTLKSQGIICEPPESQQTVDRRVHRQNYELTVAKI